MGNSSSTRSRRTSASSSQRQSSEVMETSKKIDEKECIFIAMQGEIDKAITNHNNQAMKSLASEIAAHIIDLNQLKRVDLPITERGRTQRITYNFEISLAKLKSILSSDTVVAKKIRSQSQSENSQFFVNNSTNPDLVSDLIRFDSIDRASNSERRSTLSSLPGNGTAQIYPSISRNGSIHSKPPQSVEEVLDSVEGEFNVIKDQLDRPVQDIKNYYQMDKGIFYLQVRLKNTEILQGSILNERKYRLIKELTEFRTLLDRKSGELEEQGDIIQQINTLELLVDSATDNELEGLKGRALMFQEILEKSTWDQSFTASKIDLLKRLARVMEVIAQSLSPAGTLRNSLDHIYSNMNSMQKELDNLRIQEELASLEAIDRVLEQQPEYLEDSEKDDEAIYGNVEIIRQNYDNNVTPRVQRSSSKVSQRGTVYVNADVVSQNRAIRQADNELKNQEIMNKPPLPLPRNYDDKIINDLPKRWQRLNEILDGESLSETDKLEVAEIQQHAELAKSLFERKIRKIVEKAEVCVEL